MTVTRNDVVSAMADSGIPRQSAKEILEKLWPDTDGQVFHDQTAIKKLKGKNGHKKAN